MQSFYEAARELHAWKKHEFRYVEDGSWPAPWNRKDSWAAAKACAGAVGFPYQDTFSLLAHKRPVWDGRDAMVDSPAHLCHEIGHYLVAAPSRRSLPDYGLGPLIYHGELLPQVVSEEYARLEECYASLLGLAFMQQAGMAWQTAYCGHGWLDDDFEYAASFLDGLELLGLMRRGRPTGRARPACTRLVRPPVFGIGA